MDTNEHLKYAKTLSDSLTDMEGIRTSDDNHVQGNFVYWNYKFDAALIKKMSGKTFVTIARNIFGPFVI